MTYRSPVRVLLLSIVTLGLYIIFWLFETSREMRQKGITLPSVWLFATPLLAEVVLIVLTTLISLPLKQGSTAFNVVNLVLFPVLVLIGVLAIIPLVLWWFWKYCAGVQVVTNGRLTQGSAFALFCILSVFGVGFLYPMVVQNYYNSSTPQSTLA
jgi:hypothetical protein